MAIQWMDDFTGYGTDSNRVTRLLDGIYANAAWIDLTPDPDITIGSTKYCCNIGSNSASNLRRVLNSNQTTVGVAERMYLSSLPPNTGSIPTLARFVDINANIHVQVCVNPSGYIYAERIDSPSNVQLGITSTPVVIANSWRHYEIKLVMSSTTTGSIEVRVEGQTVLTASGIRTASNIGGTTPTIAAITWSNFLATSGGVTMYIKDVIAWDNTGSANNDFMGSCQVYKISPTGDNALNWTASSGTTGYNLINETTPDEDANYIQAPYPAPSPAIFDMSNLPANVSSVRGVQLVHRSKKTDGGDAQIQTSAITSGGTSNGTDRTISTTYTYWFDVMNLAPGGGSWSKTLVDGMQVKINRTV